MSKYTPGPWKVSKPKGDDSIIAVHPPHFYFKGEVDQNTLANAHLIAAAPELLEALKSLVVACYIAKASEGLAECVNDALLDKATQAIAKAKE